MASQIASAAHAQPAASDDEKAKAEAAAAAEVEAHPQKGNFVEYLGPRNIAANLEELKTRQPRPGEGTYAEVTAAQWNAAGIESKRSHKWSLANLWRIPATQFSEDQIDHLLETQGRRFALVDAKGKKVDR